EPTEVGEFTPETDNPKTRIQDSQKPEHTKTNPVGRNEHAHRTCVESGAEVVPELGLHGVFILWFAASFSNTVRNTSVTTRVAFLNSGRSCATKGEMPIEGGIVSRIS